MEGQAVPRLQPITIHHINKGRHHTPNVTSPPLSPTSATPPVQHMETPKVKPLNKMTTPNPKSSQNGAESHKRGWLSFDDSPVHSQPANNNFQAGQSPWAAATEKQWTPFSEGASKQDAGRATKNTPGQQQRLTAQEIPPVTNTPIKPAQSVPSYHSTPTVNTSSNQHATIPKPALSESSIVSNQGSVPSYQTSDVGSRHRNASREEEGIHMEPHDGSNDFQDPWCITPEQREYYTKQFATMQADLEGKINGQSARNFFTKSKLPILELSHIWELSDMDQDGHLTLDEFCTAFHLVVARKNGYDLPSQLPQALVPTLIDITGDNMEKRVPDSNTTEGKNQQVLNHSITSPKGGDQKQEQWETFSDRTSSSTTLANFDQVLDSTTEHLHHPVAVRMTPSRHHEHWTRVGEADGEAAGSQSKTETLDEESTTSSPQTRSKVMTNPYGYLRNEPDSAGEDREIKPTRMSSSSDSTTNALDSASDKPYMRHKTKGRSHSNSSISSTTSSVATSERSSGDEDFHNSGVRSDPEHSDWSSRPLRPRSGSSSSLESGSVPAVTAPHLPLLQPPHPHRDPRSTTRTIITYRSLVFRRVEKLAVGETPSRVGNTR
uniref:RalBP1-associated Eps domain-containing protein 1-like n=1 Tax=Phallusia mammillata TaxID=59560 RepID=A0A6F9DQR3_9ASCI|nr:ralBP1-associated Eps domain-containing protein 1-like [Phallusia mammillata]